ncbi:CBS domain-containing protein [Amycolatopsis thermoflava]|uniref:CBS domain-containing protein n=1 Tax=Amycolatopsis thermoflava TaxID=84480 RepID=UPI003EB9683F
MRTLTAGSVMTRDLVTVTPDTEFKEIAALMAGAAISAVPVVGPDGALAGVVSEADLLPRGEAAGGRVRGRARRRKAAALLARDLMTSPVRTVDVGDPLPAVAKRLSGYHVRRLFVLDGGKLAGVIARRDLMGVYLRPDTDVQAEVETEVFDRVLRARPGSYRVSVTGGCVTLLGLLERRSAVRIAGELTAQVPGVLEVRNRLDYVWQDQAR